LELKENSRGSSSAKLVPQVPQARWVEWIAVWIAACAPVGSPPSMAAASD
jgi:hypothetical protein